MTLHDALEAVNDRVTFLAFVQALIDERRQANQIEADDPQSFRWAGALDWQHSTIDAYLDGALRCLQDNEGRIDFLAEPSWRGFAEFLYCGKIHE